MFISRDVLFNESLMPWKESQTSKNKPNVETSRFEIDLIGSQEVIGSTESSLPTSNIEQNDIQLDLRRIFL